MILLDLPAPLRVWRAFTRSIKDYGKTRADLAPDCPEQFDITFFKFVWDQRGKPLERMRERLNAFPTDVPTFHLKSRREIKEFLDNL